MRTVSTRAALTAALAQLPRPVGLVPTMGALHDGHAALVTAARGEQASVVLSIYVNPRQFGNPADLAAYPRTLEADAQRAAAAGVDLLFLPDDSEIYPPAVEVAAMEPGPLALRLEGAARPGHFAGVATVVSILFDLVTPEVAYFGEKDAQQVRVVEWLAERRTPPIRIRRVATVREGDGLAMSSRNARLSPAARRAASAIPQALAAVKSLYAAGERRVDLLNDAAIRTIEAEPSLTLDYIDLADDVTLLPLGASAHLSDAASGRVLVSIAASIEGVRLIDAITLRA
ncbi:MAG: pantoate--beta-alanine ligase [Chloroflexota bacterium]|jgi:pantoate--beta-alanine ligase